MICFYFGWSGSTLLITKLIKKKLVQSHSYLLAAVINFEPTYIICFVIRGESKIFVTAILVCCIFGCEATKIFKKHRLVSIRAASWILESRQRQYPLANIVEVFAPSRRSGTFLPLLFLARLLACSGQAKFLFCLFEEKILFLTARYIRTRTLLRTTVAP